LFYFVYPLYFRLVQIPRENHAVIRLLFKVMVPKGMRVTWDFTDLALRRALKKYKPASGTALEIGTGMGAVLTNYLRSISSLKLDGVDLIAERVKSSQAVCDYSRSGARIWQSDLFQNVEGKYDLVFHNAAYMPKGLVKDVLSGIGRADDKFWDGGEDIASIISRFFAQAADHLNPGGTVMLGVNNFYVPDEKITDLIKAGPLMLIDRVTMPFNPSSAYVLRTKEKTDDK
jgi:methylase of polypeptide subunit release factors